MKQSSQIMNDLELVLRGDGPKPNMGRDPELYYFTVFGTPGDKAAWGWRVEGHHLSQNFTIANGTLRVVDTGFLRRESGRGDGGLEEGTARARGRRRQGVRAAARARCVNRSRPPCFRTRFPSDMITTNARRVNPLSPDGLPASRMTPAQQKLLRELINEYTSRMVDDIAAERMRRINAAGFDKVAFVWIGADALHEPHYYRVQGPTFLIEFDNVQSQGEPHSQRVARLQRRLRRRRAEEPLSERA